jgi:hypothetical protein
MWINIGVRVLASKSGGSTGWGSIISAWCQREKTPAETKKGRRKENDLGLSVGWSSFL